jgi:hypothetical protein
VSLITTSQLRWDVVKNNKVNTIKITILNINWLAGWLTAAEFPEPKKFIFDL